MAILTGIFAVTKRWKTAIASFLMGAASAVGSVAFNDRASYYAIPDDWRNVISEMKGYAQNDGPAQIEKFQNLIQKNINSILNEKDVKVVQANLPEPVRHLVKSGTNTVH